MYKKALSIIAILMNMASPTAATGELHIMRENIKILSSSGLNTRYAVIVVELNLRGYKCRDTSDVKSECRTNSKDGFQLKNIYGNCTTKVFTDPFGKQFQFEGPSSTKDPMANYKIIDLPSRNTENGFESSGYVMHMEIYRALCPNEAPFDD